MAWEYRLVTDGVTNYEIGIRWYVSRGRVWALLDNFDWATSADLQTWHINPQPLSIATLYCAASDGQKWYYWIDGDRLAVSTDGIIGSSVTITTPVTSPGRLSSIHVLNSGRIVGYIASSNTLWTSDDDGLNWTERATLLRNATGALRLTEWPDGTITAVFNSDRGMISTDGGTSWSAVRPLQLSGLNNLVYTGAQYTAPFYITRGIAYSFPDGSFGVNSENGFVARFMDAHGATLYETARQDNVLRVRTHTGLVDDTTIFSDFDTTGLWADSTPLDIWVMPGKLVILAMRNGFSEGPRFAEYPLTPPQDFASLDWPVTIEAPEYIATPWPVDVEPAPAVVSSVPWPVSVSAPATASIGWPVSVLSATVVSGLDGAGTWSASPDGKWTAVVTLGGADISDRLHGAVTVTHADDSAAVAELSFLPASAMQPMALIGRPVRIAFAQPGGLNAQIIFAGIVDVPTVDAQTGLVTLACTDAAQEKWAAMAREQIAALVGGRWHVAVSDEPEDGFDYLGERIQSVGASWAFDTNGTARILPWRGLAKIYSIKPADVIDGSLSIDLPSREQLRTRIKVRMQYRYPLLRARYAVCRYAQSIGTFLPSATPTRTWPGAQWLTTPMVEGAADSVSGWYLRSLTIEHPPARSWPIGIGAAAGYYTVSPSVAGDLVLSFTAAYATRWQQSVTEDYTVEVVATALEALVGQPISEEIGASLEAEFDQPGWESDPSIAPLRIIELDMPVMGDQAQAWQPAGADTADRDEVMRTLLDRAWVRLWSASRSGRVTFALPCRPDMWLDAAATVESGAVRAAGKIVEVTHELDLDSGAATTTATVAVGMPGNADASLPAWSLPEAPAPAAAPPLSAYSFKCGTYIGGQLSSEPFDRESMIGFSTNVNGADDPALEYYPHQLTVKAPEIAAHDRDPQERKVETVVTVDVPTDLLEIV